MKHANLLCQEITTSPTELPEIIPGELSSWEPQLYIIMYNIICIKQLSECDSLDRFDSIHWKTPLLLMWILGLMFVKDCSGLY